MTPFKCVSLMLAKFLALGVGFGSVIFYVAAFFFPEVHRRHDFFWSGIGLFYALMLWTCAGQITGAVLLGQLASVALLGALGWQTLRLRRLRTPQDLRTPADAEAWQGLRIEMISLLKDIWRRSPLSDKTQFSPAPSSSNKESGLTIRASALRQVGYEYLDDIPEPTKPAAQKPSGPKSSTPATSTAPKAASSGAPIRKPPVKPPGSTLKPIAKIVIFKDWVVDLWQSLSRPKPSKPVINIPPRPASVRQTRETAQSHPPNNPEASDTTPEASETTPTQSSAINSSPDNSDVESGESTQNSN